MHVSVGIIALWSSGIATVIHTENYRQRNDDWYMEPFAVPQCNNSDWYMHGLIFETSIWLLAGSTRLLFSCRRVCNQTCRNPSCKLFLEYVLGSELVAHSEVTGKYGLRDKWTQALSIIYLAVPSHTVTKRCSQAVSALVIQPTFVEIILQKKYGGLFALKTHTDHNHNQMGKASAKGDPPPCGRTPEAHVRFKRYCKYVCLHIIRNRMNHQFAH